MGCKSHKMTSYFEMYPRPIICGIRVGLSLYLSTLGGSNLGKVYLEIELPRVGTKDGEAEHSRMLQFYGIRYEVVVFPVIVPLQD